jgi:hypothetical protein
MVFMSQWEKENAALYPVEVPPPWQTASMLPMARKHSVLNLREINRNNKHIDLASVLTYCE